MSRAALRLAAGVLIAAMLAGSASVCSAANDDPDAAAYRAQWRQAGTAIAAFANAPLVQPGASAPDAVLRVYDQTHDQLASALASLSETLPPAQAALAHWELLPLYDNVLSAMTLVRDATRAHDAAALAAAWLAFRDALGQLRKSAAELGPTVQ
jgi:hypothetical protein